MFFYKFECSNKLKLDIKYYLVFTKTEHLTTYSGREIAHIVSLQQGRAGFVK